MPWAISCASSFCRGTATTPSASRRCRGGIEFGALFGDKACGSNWIVQDLVQRGAKVVISQHPGHAQKLKVGAGMCNWRHLIEYFSRKLIEFKSVAMRACKSDQSFSAKICLAAAVINSR